MRVLTLKLMLASLRLEKVGDECILTDSGELPQKE
jgi:hypothetical protein